MKTHGNLVFEYKTLSIIVGSKYFGEHVTQ
ncbi:hypothetical protein DYBT9275_03257 [Dyadobacter sp. CECT 9275]|uniref:Uncharacterized protein n=1 Tax=Dyadobacter helix TaxID=2822344 RepID=A0A916JDM6_9BACT|nr:hypothetical protein DYBT9275_03257 [Dyadobacter sp. CECT 9275]